MAEPLVLALDYLVPEGVADAVAYQAGAPLPGSEILDRVGFFVPAYLNHPNPEWMASMPALEVVQLPTIGYESVLPHVPPGATLCNAAGVHEQSTAELAVGMIISRWRGLDRAARDMSMGRWDHRRGRSLQGATVVIVGSGGVGTRIASSLAPFGCDVQLVARTRREAIAGRDELPRLLVNADVVVIAVPLTPSTQSMVDDSFLSTIPDGALVVNVARGGVAVTADLVRHAGRLDFALDVVDPEPLPEDHPLWSAPNVLITPHIGGDTDAFPRLARELIQAQIHRWRNGEKLVNIVASE